MRRWTEVRKEGHEDTNLKPKKRPGSPATAGEHGQSAFPLCAKPEAPGGFKEHKPSEALSVRPETLAVMLLAVMLPAVLSSWKMSLYP